MTAQQMDRLDRQIYDQQYTVLVMDHHFVTGNQTQMTFIPTQIDRLDRFDDDCYYYYK